MTQRLRDTNEPDVLDNGVYIGDALTVAELIAELQKMPPEARVLTEGCDCTGQATSVRLQGDGTVLIER